MARWAALKFHTEFGTIREVSRLHSLDGRRRFDADTFIQTYARQVAAFALRHTLFPADALSVGTLAAAILACDTEHQLSEAGPELSENFQRIDEEVLYYFYVHGN